MNKKNVDWTDLQLFLAVAREGGLSSAAKVSQRSPATLGRRMHALEQTLGRELFIRHDRGYELLTEGKQLLDKLAEVESQIQQMSNRPVQGHRPLVKISAGTWTTYFITQNLSKLLEAPSSVRVRFLSSEKILDIPHREIAIGIRNQRPTEASLVCKRLKRVEFAPYATKGAPELWIKVIADTPSARWVEKTIGSDALCEVSEPRNSLDLALAGQGIALLPTFIGDGQPGLERVGTVIDELGHDRWLVTHQEDRNLPEVRQLIDRISVLL